MSSGNGPTPHNDVELGEQAAQWLLQLEDTDADPQDEYPDEKSRNRAFFEWIETSPDHLRLFLETVETHRRLQLIDARHLMEVTALLRHKADVIQIHGSRPTSAVVEAAPERQSRGALAWRAVFAARPDRRRVHPFNIAAAILVCALSAGGYWWATERHAYSTLIGEQRSAKLDDGSFIHLNTDSKVEVDFSGEARNVRLVRGEALFVVARDSSRPFTVTAGDTSVRALGTQFNVRRNSQGAEVAVVQGAVKVTTMDNRAGGAAQNLIAGEEASVIEGRIAPHKRQVVAEALAWRQRRLVFHDARLAEVAAEFNRYNRIKFRIEDDAVKELRLSGIFDADRPMSLILYVAKTSEFTVEPSGSDWVIRRR